MTLTTCLIILYFYISTFLYNWFVIFNNTDSRSFSNWRFWSSLTNLACVKLLLSLSLSLDLRRCNEAVLSPYVLNTDVHIQSSRYPSVLEHWRCSCAGSNRKPTALPSLFFPNERHYNGWNAYIVFVLWQVSSYARFLSVKPAATWRNRYSEILTQLSSK